jgi:hypothetical protein
VSLVFRLLLGIRNDRSVSARHVEHLNMQLQFSCAVAIHIDGFVVNT